MSATTTIADKLREYEHTGSYLGAIEDIYALIHHAADLEEEIDDLKEAAVPLTVEGDGSDLPFGSVVIDCDGDAWQRDPDSPPTPSSTPLRRTPMTEDTAGFLRRENSDLRLEVEHLREKTERMGQELAVLRERDFLGRLLEERHTAKRITLLPYLKQMIADISDDRIVEDVKAGHTYRIGTIRGVAIELLCQLQELCDELQRTRDLVPETIDGGEDSRDAAEGTTVVDPDGEPWVFDDGGWVRLYPYCEELRHEELQEQYGPYTIVYTPKEES